MVAKLPLESRKCLIHFFECVVKFIKIKGYSNSNHKIAKQLVLDRQRGRHWPAGQCPHNLAKKEGTGLSQCLHISILELLWGLSIAVYASIDLVDAICEAELVSERLLN